MSTLISESVCTLPISNNSLFFPRRIIMRLAISLIVVFSVVATAAAEDAVKKEMAQLDGEWSMVSGEANGIPLSEAMVKTGKRAAKDGETSITFDGQPYFKAKFSIDPTKKPKTIDYS